MEVCVGGGLLQGRGTQCSSASTGPFEEGFLYLCYHQDERMKTTTTEN